MLSVITTHGLYDFFVGDLPVLCHNRITIYERFDDSFSVAAQKRERLIENTMFGKKKEKKIKQHVRLKYKGAWRFCDFLDQGVEEDGNHPYFNLQYIRYGVIDPVGNQLLFYTFDNGRTFLVEEDYLKLSKK